MAELVTKADLTELVRKADLAGVWADLAAVRQDLTNTISHFDTKLENQSLRLTVRLGLMLVAAVALLATLIKLA